MEHKVRVMLTDDELQLPAIDDLCNKYFDWLKLSKETTRGRKTRAANRRVDTVFDEIIAFKLPPIKLATETSLATSPIRQYQQQNNYQPQQYQNSNHSNDSDTSTMSASSRTLRPRSVTPSTPTQQSIRAHMKKNLDSGGSSVLTAALNQQHPSVSVTKIRQLLNANSAQKKREEEKERQDRLKLEWKQKEERAEAQKKRLMEEKAISAKQNRELRLKRAAEVRKEREKAKIQEKLRAPLPAPTPIKNTSNSQPAKVAAPKQDTNHQKKKIPTKEIKSKKEQPKEESPEEVIVAESSNSPVKVDSPEPKSEKIEQSEPVEKAHKLDETFKKPSNDQNNIDISIHDETTDSQGNKTKGVQVASWAKAPHLRNAIIAQFDNKSEDEILSRVLEIFAQVEMPVKLEVIFGGSKSVNNRYAIRSSSAHWSSPGQLKKRTSSVALTPTNPPKR